MFMWSNVDGFFNFMQFRINYALYEELDAEDIERTRDVYRYGAYFFLI